MTQAEEVPTGTWQPAGASPVGNDYASLVETSGSSVVKGGVWTSIANVVPQFYSIALSIATARILGPTDTGRQSYVSFILAFVVVLAGFGFPTGLQRYISEALGRGDVRTAQRYIRYCWTGAIVAGAIGAGMVAVASLLVYPDLRSTWFVAAACSFFVIAHSFISQPLYALQRFRVVSIFGLIGGLLTLVLAIPALVLGDGIFGFFLAGLPPAVIMAVGSAWLMWRETREVRRPIPRRAIVGPPPAREEQSLIRFSLKAFVADFVEFILNRRSEFFFLQAWSPPAQLALYSIGFSAVSSAAQVPAALATVVLPAVSNLVGAGQHHRIVNGYRRSLRLIFHITVPLAFAAVVLGPVAIRLFFGSQYSGSDPLVYIMAPVSLVVAPAGAIALAVLAGLGRMGARSAAGVLALCVNLLLDLLLIRPHAAVGAAIANTAGQLVAALLGLVVLQRVLHASWVTVRLWRTVVASLIGFVASLVIVRLVRPAGSLVELLAGGVVFCIAYAVMAMAMRVIGADESRTLIGAIPSRLDPVRPLLQRVCQQG